MRIGFIEPHLGRFGGIRRMVEFANRLVARGHAVTFYLPETAEMQCTWMRCDAEIRPLQQGFAEPLDVVLYNKEGSWESVHAAVDLQLANSNWTADQICAATGHRPTVQLGGVNRDVFQPGAGPKRYPLLCSGEQQRAWKGTDTI